MPSVIETDSGKFKIRYKNRNGKYSYRTSDWERESDARLEALQLEKEEREIARGIRNPRADKLEFASLAKDYCFRQAISGGRRGFDWSPEYKIKVSRALARWELRMPEGRWWAESSLKTTVATYIECARKQSKSPKTIRNEVAYLHAFLIWMVAEGNLDRDPLFRVRLPAPASPRVPRRALDEEEAGKLFEVCNTDERVLLALMLSTGLRAKEARSLDFGKLNPQASELILEAQSAKNRKETRVLLSKELSILLFGYGTGNRANALYAKHKKKNEDRMRRGTKLPDNPLVFVPTQSAEWIQRLCRKAGVDPSHVGTEGKIDFHGLRTTYITHLIMTSDDLGAIVKLARHSDPRLPFALYDKAKKSRLQNVQDKVNNVLVPRFVPEFVPEPILGSTQIASGGA